jgi:hypothetical protein
MIPSLIRNNISGQINSLGKVTSHLMKETEMGYRGSKSEILNIPKPNRTSVKEQRVDGSWFLNKNLRCTLMDFERNYQTRIPSKQFSQQFSTSIFKLNPWFITGFIDAEGTFCTTIYQNTAYKTGWVVRSFF